MDHHGQSLLLDLEPGLQLFYPVTSPARLDGRNELLGGQTFGRLRVALGVIVGCLGAGDRPLLIQSLGLQIGPQVHPLGLGDGELALRFQRLELHVRIAEL